ncbi:MAG: site-2 protease family protein [Ruminococcaceae bacterium]|nr:site-2 protease family protein [Oscillospiraceae bacterium]
MQGLLAQMFGTTNGVEILIMMLTRVFIVLTILPVHEFAHAWMAKKLGDDTAQRMGRLTLNPFMHLSGIGAALLILFGFGFAKPVPVNPYNFTNQKKRRGGMALTALAGPLSNLIMAVLAVILFCVSCCISPSAYFYVIRDDMYSLFYPDPDVWSYVGYFLMQFSVINISLAVFNLLPIPPLDGSRIFGLLFPEKWMMAIEKYSFVIIMALFMIMNRVSGVGNALGAVTTKIFILLNNGISWVFELFGAQLIYFA